MARKMRALCHEYRATVGGGKQRASRRRKIVLSCDVEKGEASSRVNRAIDDAGQKRQGRGREFPHLRARRKHKEARRAGRATR